MIGRKQASKLAVTTICLLLAGACSVPGPSESHPLVDASVSIAEPNDPAEALAGRAVEAIGNAGVDVVMRLGAEGFRLPDDERLVEVYGERVLSFREGQPGGNTRLILRDLEGNLVREVDAPFSLLRAAMVRGEDLYFAGIDSDQDTLMATDRGAWVAHGDDSPEQILAPTPDHTVYWAVKVSPDGRTVGILRCRNETCSTNLIGADGTGLELPKPGLIELTNEVALLVEEFRGLTAYAITDGAELWRTETEGIYDEHYATTAGEYFVIGSFEDTHDGDENLQDQLRLEVLNAQSGEVERTVLLPNEEGQLAMIPSLSTDRYVALLETWLPNVDEGPHSVKVVDLEAGELLDLELTLDDVP